MAKNKTFAALEAVLAALAPLDPEERRKVIEAVHALVDVSPGRQDGGDGGPGPDERAPRGRKRA